MTGKATPEYLRKVVQLGDTELELFSIDGLTWSSRPDELHLIQERRENSRVSFGDKRAAPRPGSNRQGVKRADPVVGLDDDEVAVVEDAEVASLVVDVLDDEDDVDIEPKSRLRSSGSSSVKESSEKPEKKVVVALAAKPDVVPAKKKFDEPANGTVLAKSSSAKLAKVSSPAPKLHAITKGVKVAEKHKDTKKVAKVVVVAAKPGKKDVKVGAKAGSAAKVVAAKSAAKPRSADVSRNKPKPAVAAKGKVPSKKSASAATKKGAAKKAALKSSQVTAKKGGAKKPATKSGGKAKKRK